MNLRQALETLGPDRVRAGMRAIDERRDGSQLATCFVGEAAGGTSEGFMRAVHPEYFGFWQGLRCWLGRPAPALSLAFKCVEAWYEGENYRQLSNKARFWARHLTLVPSTAESRAECVAYLAEHGSASESVVAPRSRLADSSNPEVRVLTGTEA